MCKEGWCVGLGQEGLSEGGESIWNTLKGVEQKRGEEKQISHKRGQAGSRGRCLKKGGWNPLTNYDF